MEKKLKIIILDPANLTPFYDYALASALSDIGHDVSVFATKYLQDPELKSPDNIRFCDFYFHALRGLQESKGQKVRQLIRGFCYPFDHYRLIKALRKEKPDVVHIQWSLLPVLDLKLVKKLQSMGIRVVHTVHDVTPLFDMGKHKRLEKLYAAVDAIVVHSQESYTAFCERYGKVDKNKVNIAPHGPLQNEKLDHYSSEAARKELGIANESAVALFFGEIKHYKGLHDLVECFPDVTREVENAFLLIAGKPDSDGVRPNTAFLEKRCVAYKADIGFVPNDKVWTYYLAADIVVLPYINISQSGVLFSAVANGKPVVTTNVGGLPEIVEATEAGWVVPQGDKAALTGAIVDALKDRSRCEEMGKVAKEKLDDLYGWESIAKKTGGIYQNILA